MKRINIKDGWFIFKYDYINTWYLYKEHNRRMFDLNGSVCSWFMDGAEDEVPSEKVRTAAKLMAGSI